MKKHIIRLLVVMLSVCLGMAVISACTKPKTYTVTYLAGGGTGTAPTVEKYKEGEEFTVKENTFTYEGYTFTTWNDGAKNVAPGAKYVMPAKDITFTAQWKKEIVDNYSGYWTGEAEGAKLGESYAGKTFDVEAAVMLDETDLFVAFMFTEKGGAAKLGAGVHGTVSEEGAIDFNGTAGKLENDKLTIPFGEEASIEFSGRKALGDAAEPDGVYSSGEEGEEKFLDFNRGAIKLDAAFVDAEFLSIGKYIVGYQEMGEVSLSPFAAVMDGDNIVYYDMAGDTYTFTPYDGEITEAYAYTSATLEATADKVYVVVSGTFSGYTKNGFEAALKDSNENVLAPNVCLSEKPWTWQETTTEVEVNSDGTWTVKIDITALEGTIPFSVCMDKSGSGDIKTLPEDANATKELGTKKYTLKLGKSGTLTINIGEAGKSHAYTGMSLEATADKVYLTITGTFTGYTDEEFKGKLEDDNKNELFIGITATKAAGDLAAWGWPECPTTVTTENGQFTVKIDVTEVPVVIYYICEDNSGSGDIVWNADAFTSSVTFGDKKYTIEKNGYGNTQLNVEAYVEIPEDATYEVTAFTLEKQGDKVYLLYKGTCANYDAETLEAALKALPLRMDIHKINGTATGADGTGWTFSMGEGTWEMKIDITAGESDYFTPGSIFFIDGLNNYSDGGKYYNLWNQQLTIELGTNLYKAGAPIGEKQGDPIYTWGNVTFSIESTIVPTYTFSAPTSAKLELMNDKGNGTDENFENEIGRAFFVLSGTYTGEVTEAIAKDHFKQANYPFQFGGLSLDKTKDRIRRISIDTEAKTWTLKFDVTWLAPGEYICRFGPKGGSDDLTLSTTACPDNSVKAVGSTFELKNYADNYDTVHWGCIYLTVTFNYAVTGVDFTAANNKAAIVVNGTYETEAFTAEQIKSFLEDEDVRTMCVDLYGSAWTKLQPTVTAEDGKFSVTLDVSSTAAGSYIVASDCSGNGNIKNVTINKTIAAKGTMFTLAGTSGSDLTLKITKVTYAVTGAKVEEASEKINLVLSGTYADCSDADITAYMQVVYYDIQHNDNLDRMGWDRLNKYARTVTAAEGNWTLTLDITALTVGSYGIHFDSSDGIGGDNNNTESCKPTDQTLNDKEFKIGTKTFKFVYDPSSNKAEYFWGTLGMIMTDTNAPELDFTKAALTAEDNHVYLVLTASVKGYTQQELETIVFIGETGDMTLKVSSVTLADGTATLKFDFTGIGPNGKWWWGHYTINGGAQLSVNAPLETEGGAKTTEVTMGEYKYTLKHNGSEADQNDQIIVTIENA